jgi:ferredoxin
MKAKITKVTVNPGCVSCGACAVICSEVFELKGTSRVKANASYDKNIDLIHEAADNCPVGVIEIEEEL